LRGVLVPPLREPALPYVPKGFPAGHAAKERFECRAVIALRAQHPLHFLYRSDHRSSY
jgi:hypothetical protein